MRRLQQIAVVVAATVIGGCLSTLLVAMTYDAVRYILEK